MNSGRRRKLGLLGLEQARERRPQGARLSASPLPGVFATHGAAHTRTRSLPGEPVGSPEVDQ